MNPCVLTFGDFRKQDLSRGLTASELQAMHHVSTVASRTGLDINSLNMYEHFVTDGKLETNKDKLNEYIFKIRTMVEEVPIDDGITGPQMSANKEHINRKAGTSHIDVDLENAAYRLRTVETTLASYLLEVTIRRTSLKEIHEEIDKLLILKDAPQATDQVFNALMKVVDNPFWQYLGVENSYVYFVTTKNVVTTFDNPIAGISETMNSGMIAVGVNLANNEVISKCVWGNIDSIVNGNRINWHPHIGTRGGICTGSENAYVSSKLAELDYHAAFIRIQEVLTQYNDEDPFVNISVLNRTQRRPRSGNRVAGTATFFGVSLSDMKYRPEIPVTVDCREWDSLSPIPKGTIVLRHDCEDARDNGRPFIVTMNRTNGDIRCQPVFHRNTYGSSDRPTMYSGMNRSTIHRDELAVLSDPYNDTRKAQYVAHAELYHRNGIPTIGTRIKSRGEEFVIYGYTGSASSNITPNTDIYLMNVETGATTSRYAKFCRIMDNETMTPEQVLIFMNLTGDNPTHEFISLVDEVEVEVGAEVMDPWQDLQEQINTPVHLPF